MDNMCFPDLLSDFPDESKKKKMMIKEAIVHFKAKQNGKKRRCITNSLKQKHPA